MRKEDFIKALYSAGWDSLTDAQHSKIEKLWRQLFPVVAALSDEVEDLESELLKSNQGN